MKDNSRVIVEFCNCHGNHKIGCPLHLRLLIKEKICEKYGVVNYISPKIVNEIDKEVKRKLSKWLKLIDLGKKIINEP